MFDVNMHRELCNYGEIVVLLHLDTRALDGYLIEPAFLWYCIRNELIISCCRCVDFRAPFL